MTRKPYSNTLTTRSDICSFLCLLPILMNLAFFAVYEPGLCRRGARSAPLQVTHSTLKPDKWQLESPPAKERNQGGFHSPQRWDFTKPAKLPKSYRHSALKAVHRKGTSLQHQVSDESWNKHLPKAMLLPISWSKQLQDTVAFTDSQPAADSSECSGLTSAAKDEGSRCQVMEEQARGHRKDKAVSWCEVRQQII